MYINWQGSLTIGESILFLAILPYLETYSNKGSSLVTMERLRGARLLEWRGCIVSHSQVQCCLVHADTERSCLLVQDRSYIEVRGGSCLLRFFCWIPTLAQWKAEHVICGLLCNTTPAVLQKSPPKTVYIQLEVATTGINVKALFLAVGSYSVGKKANHPPLMCYWLTVEVKANPLRGW